MSLSQRCPTSAGQTRFHVRARQRCCERDLNLTYSNFVEVITHVKEALLFNNPILDFRSHEIWVEEFGSYGNIYATFGYLTRSRSS